MIVIVPVEKSDLKCLSDIFWNHLTAHPEYISHGEMQMGVGEPSVDGDNIVGKPSADGKDMWDRYIEGKFLSSDAAVFKAVEDGGICGFCVVDIMEDGAEPFGMVCDVLVLDEYRGKGVGSILLDKAVMWLRDRGIKDIYLESGKENHNAHRFFEKKGFRHISDIFKLK